MFFATLILAACGSTAALVQDKPAPPPPMPVPAKTAPLVDVDGKELVAGAIPASTTAAARERWQKVVDTSLPGGTERAPVTAFDLTIDMRYRASASQTNDAREARYRWLAPGFVRTDTGRGQVHLRGPKGSYRIDAHGAEKLDVGRENAEDRRQLDEQAGIAANFARLTDPKSIRIRKLVELSGPPARLPDALKPMASKLVWLEIESPDFFVMRPAAKPTAPLARVSLGVNGDQRVEQVLIDDAAAPPVLGASTAVLKLSEYKPLDGFQVPFVILVWLPELPPADAPHAPPRWTPKETMSLYLLKASSLRAPLTPDDFLPPPAK